MGHRSGREPLSSNSLWVSSEEGSSFEEVAMLPFVLMTESANDLQVLVDRVQDIAAVTLD